MKGNSIAAGKTKKQAEIKNVENMIKQLYREKYELSLYIYKEIFKDKDKLIMNKSNSTPPEHLLPELSQPVAATQDAII
jgi:hypothetical protein